jgi:hypothetical protein
MKKVYVVTCPELGWDCVVGIFDADEISLEKLKETFPTGYGQQYVIHMHDLETNLDNY